MSKVFVSVPVYDRPEMDFIISLLAAKMSSQHEIVLYREDGCSSLTHVRNRHISKFLFYGDCTHYCQLDGDLVLYNATKGNNIFDMLLSHDAPFVGGLYAYRCDMPGAPMKCASVPVPFVPPARNSGLVEMDFLSGGCWMVSREAVQAMADANNGLRFEDENESRIGLFLPIILDYGESRRELSEDWAFCHRWKAVGGKIYADTAIILGHIGKKEYLMWEPEPHLGSHMNHCHVDDGALAELMRIFGIKSMVDVGCGTGGTKASAARLGIKWVGIEGDPNMAKPNVFIHDFTKGPCLAEKPLDLAWSVEFVEHVDEKHMDNYMQTFAQCRVVCMTHAEPGAVGAHHVNCQPQEYWISAFRDRGFDLDAKATERVRIKSTMFRDFMRTTGMVFVRR